MELQLAFQDLLDAFLSPMMAEEVGMARSDNRGIVIYENELDARVMIPETLQNGL